MMMIVCIKQHKATFEAQFIKNFKQHWGSVEKKAIFAKKKRVVHKVGKKKKDVYKSVFYTLINLYIIYYITTIL